VAVTVAAVLLAALCFPNLTVFRAQNCVCIVINSCHLNKFFLDIILNNEMSETIFAGQIRC